MTKSIVVEKFDGSKEQFSQEKYRAALKRSGLTPSEIDTLIADLLPGLPPTIAAKDLYSKTFEYLKTMRSSVACRYSLKQAIMKLGPSGYPFEQFIASVFEAQGYETQVGVVVAGKCVTHEVDVIAKKGEEQFFVECKFHNKQHFRSRIKDPLYVKARFDDLFAGYKEDKKGSMCCHHGMLVTNTKFSGDVIEYGPCAGIGLLSWNYPKKASLAYLVDTFALHPITCLASLSNIHIKALLKEGIVLCRDLKDNEKILRAIVKDKALASQILDDVHALCAKM